MFNTSLFLSFFFLLLSLSVVVCNSSDFPCTIDRVSNLSGEDFLSLQRPVIIQNIIPYNEPFRLLVSLQSLYERFGERQIILASSNTYSRKKKKMSMKEYVKSIQGAAVSSSAEAEETYYFFGDYRDEEWEELFQHYTQPSWAHGLSPRLSFGVGSHLSGVPFHFHGPAFSEVFHGSKRWFVYPKGQPMPGFDPSRTTLQWLEEVYPSLADSERPLECVIKPGEVLYFPDMWYHATLNLNDTVFMSTFVLETEIRRKIRGLSQEL